MSDYSKPLPRPTATSRPFWEAAKRHELMLQRCGGCQAFNPAFAKAAKHAIVEVDEGPRRTTNLEAAPDQIRIEMPVTACFDDVTPERTLVKFRPA